MWNDNTNPLNNWWTAFAPSEEQIEAAAQGYDFKNPQSYFEVCMNMWCVHMFMHVVSSLRVHPMIYHIINVFFYGKLLFTIQLLWIKIEFVYLTQEKNIDYEKALAKYEEDKKKAYEEYKRSKEQEWNDFKEEDLASAQEKYFR